MSVELHRIKQVFEAYICLSLSLRNFDVGILKCRPDIPASIVINLKMEKSTMLSRTYGSIKNSNQPSLLISMLSHLISTAINFTTLEILGGLKQSSHLQSNEYLPSKAISIHYQAPRVS